ncbi:Alpha-mannosidase 2C1 [Phlyctochytrium bullatum]|nr:Alpha-mannosidase 2C1 [Phlyctochytrium bullatum]
MDEYPDFKFVASQAQQFEWVEQLYPGLFERIKEKVKTGQFVPLGGTWVEMDCNMPSDSFGYNGQLPQIMRSAGIKYFYSQKLLWSNINKFPNTTFHWQGIDGTKVLTFFSPEGYVSQADVGAVVRTVRDNKDLGYTKRSMILYGNGDGGGGPLRPMIERFTRMQTLDGMPATIKFASPVEFFKKLEASSHDLVTWRGELYLEYHRGTYTAQSIIKRYNRHLEFLLRDVELLCTLALTVVSSTPYKNPKDELDRMWKWLLLNQFHDVLPGSSIAMVYEDAIKFYRDIEATGTRLREEALDILEESLNADEFPSYSRGEYDLVAQTPGDSETFEVKGEAELLNEDGFVEVGRSQPNTLVMSNQFLKVTLDAHGRITSLLDLQNK